MDQMNQGTQRQVVIRMFQPDMAVLKAAAKQLAEKPDLKLRLYGQGGEALLVLAAQAGGTAAATEIAERAATFIEKKMGDTVYARGKDTSLVHVAARVMIEEECSVICADADTGALMETEFKNTKLGDRVYDFGQSSYRNARMAAKIANTALMDDEEDDDALQQAADRSYAAAKCTRAEFGAAITGLTKQDGEAVFAAVTHRGYTYIRAIRPAPDAGKAAALTVLDMIRRLLKEMPVSYARRFKAGREVDWDAPLEGKAGKAGGKKGGKSLVVPIVALVVLAAILGVAVWFIYNTFFIKDDPSLPVDGSAASVSQSIAASLPATDASLPVDDGAQSGAPVADDAAQSTPPVQSTATGVGNTTGGVVHPFG